jgi:geranylgeranyl reductase family protein
LSGALELDALVVGAGPAGSAAAATLARGGLDVLVVDKAPIGRDKTCGDGLTTGALRRLDALGLDPRSVASFTPVNALSVRSEYGRIAELPLARTGGCAAAVARRRDLDASLVELARAAGAQVRDADGLETLEFPTTAGGRCRGVLASGTEVAARYVVAADGAWSRVRAQMRTTPEPRAPGGRVLEGGWHAYRAYATGVAPAALERLWVSFDPALLPGYAWSFPLAGGATNVGICLRRTAGVSGPALAAAWRDAIDGPFLRSLLGPDAELEAPARSWPIPAGIDRTELTSADGRVLFVGDAACAADPFTGEGIAQALESSTLAARSIVELGATSPERAAAQYAAEIRRSLAREHRLGRAIASVLSHPVGARGAVRLAGWGPWTRRNAGRWLFEDVPRTMPFTPTLWRRGLLEQPPPYARLSRG